MNKDTAVAQANLNRINQYTPQGSLTYSQVGTNADGTPKYSQTQTLSPDEQAKYEQQNKIALALGNTANNNISRVDAAQATPFTYDGMTNLRTSVGQGLPFGIKAGPTGAYGTQGAISDAGQIQRSIGPNNLSADGQRVANSVYGQATSRLDPQWQQSEGDTRSKLAAQGISENSDAYRRELDNQSRAKTDAYNQANYSAIQAGGAEQSRLFGIDQAQGQFANSAQDQQYQQYTAMADLFNQSEAQRFGQDQGAAGFNNTAQNQAFNQDSASAGFSNNARQQQIEQAAYLRNLPLNDIAALMGATGGVNQPNFNPVSQVGVSAPDYQGLVTSGYNAKMAQYNAQQQARSSMLGSIFGALGSVGGAVAMSDRRFKEALRRIGTLPNGLPTYAFRYIGSKAQQFGVMAQDALRIIPQAVVHTSNGMFVDYSKVY